MPAKISSNLSRYNTQGKPNEIYSNLKKSINRINDLTSINTRNSTDTLLNHSLELPNDDNLTKIIKLIEHIKEPYIGSVAINSGNNNETNALKKTIRMKRLKFAKPYGYSNDHSKLLQFDSEKRKYIPLSVIGSPQQFSKDTKFVQRKFSIKIMGQKQPPAYKSYNESVMNISKPIIFSSNKSTNDNKSKDLKLVNLYKAFNVGLQEQIELIPKLINNFPYNEFKFSINNNEFFFSDDFLIL